MCERDFGRHVGETLDGMRERLWRYARKTIVYIWYMRRYWRCARETIGDMRKTLWNTRERAVFYREEYLSLWPFLD